MALSESIEYDKIEVVGQRLQSGTSPQSNSHQKRWHRTYKVL